MILIRSMTILAAFSLAAFAGDVSGKWVGKMTLPNGETRDTSLTLKADGEKLTGTASGRQGETPIQDGKVKGDDLSFVLVRNFNGNEFKMTYKGKVTGNDLKISVETPQGAFDINYKRAE